MLTQSKVTLVAEKLLVLSGCTLVAILLMLAFLTMLDAATLALIVQHLYTPTLQTLLGSADRPALFVALLIGISSLLLAWVDYRRYRRQTQLLTLEQKQRIYLDEMSMALIDCDLRGLITGWNAGAERIFGYQKADALGQPFAALLTPPETQGQITTIFTRLQQRSSSGEIRTVIRNRDSNGKLIICSWAIAGIWVAEGTFLGFVCGAIEITEQLEKERELQLAKEAAETATRAKSAFLANMSHEIRTPMNGIIGMSNLLLTTQLDAHQSDYIGNIQRSTTALLDIINEILDFFQS
ncbi:MAG: histidine kinase dimerization/phospho-acceptor domain-containing protein [Caldilineaceae bacterium]